ncbi:hypothetical protein C8R47DRAFT_961119, partial [Mycena vitilis]
DSEKGKVLQSIASVIQALPPAEGIAPIEAMVGPILQRLSAALSAVGAVSFLSSIFIRGAYAPTAAGSGASCCDSAARDSRGRREGPDTHRGPERVRRGPAVSYRTVAAAAPRPQFREI